VYDDYSKGIDTSMEGMSMNIYVGNLPYSVGAEDLRTLFENYGSVTGAFVISDKATGRSRGFGFVEMDDENEARTGIESTNGALFSGRTLVVNEARPRDEQPRGPRRDFRGGGGDRRSNRYE
jgi:RNA recognition motif-containing protein